MYNCMTSALKIEDMNITSNLDLWYSRNPEDEIREKIEKAHLNRKLRRLENENSPLEEGEWLIAFFGFIPYKFDYEGRPEMWDYHFIYMENGKWMHRSHIGAEITEIEKDLFKNFEVAGYPPQFFAVKRVEG